MFEQARPSPRQWATAVVLRFAETTNLSIAGRRFDVRGAGPLAPALSALLAAIGARRIERGERPDYLFCTGEDASPLTRADLSFPSASGGARPLLVVDATPEASATASAFASADASAQAPALDGGVAPVEQLRDGVWATNVPDVVLVRLDRDRRAPELSPAVARIAWARRFMSTAEGLAARLKADGTVRGLRVGLSMVLEPKTAVLALTLREAGAEVAVFAHPDETDDTVAAALTDAGLRVYARSDAGPAEHRELASAFLAEHPQVLVDDGSHVIRLAHETAPEVLAGLIGAAEETTSGLRPLRTMAEEGRLKIPVVAVNDARSKTLFDNRYGTGQSCLFTILGLTDLDLATSTVVVAGYGHVGEGVAHHARALGATVVVTELDPVRALAASFDGFRVAPLLEAVASAQLVVSATGVRDTISLPVLLACARDAVVAVAGGVPQEVAIDDALAQGAVRETIGRKRERFTFATGSSLVILDDGGCINVTAGEGNPIEIMDLSFAVQLAAIRQLVESAGSLTVGVHPLPAQADDAVAAEALKAAGVRIDTRTGPAPAAEIWPRFGGEA